MRVVGLHLNLYLLILMLCCMNFMQPTCPKVDVAMKVINPGSGRCIDFYPKPLSSVDLMLHNMPCIALSRIFKAKPMLQVLTHEFSGTKKLTFKSFCLQNLVLQLSIVFIFIFIFLS